MASTTLTVADTSGVLGSGSKGYAAPSAGSVIPEPYPTFPLVAVATGVSGFTNKIVVYFMGDCAAALVGSTLTVDGGSPLPITDAPLYSAPYTALSFGSYAAFGSIGATHTLDFSMVLPTYDGPTWIAKTNALSASGNLAFGSTGRQAGDLLFILMESANQAFTAPSGATFTELATYSPQSRGTAAAAGGLRGALYYRISDGTEGNIAFTAPANHGYAVGGVIRPASGQTIAIDVSTGSNVAATTSVSIPGVTTTVDDCLILHAVYTDRDSAGPSFSSEANAGLVNLTERHDAGTTTGVGGGIAIYTGEKWTAGASGSTTATQAASVALAYITIALKNVSGSSGPAGRSDETNSALVLAGKHLRATGRSDSTETALALTGKHIRAAGLATETDTAFALVPVQIRATGRADETDTAFALTAAGTPVGLAEETESAFALAPVAIRVTGRADEADTALALGSARPVGLASESDTAFALAAVQIAQTGRADSTEAALSLAGVQALAVGLASETNTALLLAGTSIRAIGLAQSQEGAFALGIAASVGLAVETDEAFALGIGAPAQAANENDVALPLGSARPVGIVEETDEALALIGVVPMEVPTSRTIAGAGADRSASGSTTPRTASGSPTNRTTTGTQPSRTVTAVTRPRVAA